MEADLKSVEVIFAQKLACGEPVTRQRAFRTLQDWIKQQSAVRPFTEADMMRLCKGLHYVLWMQDKMLLQEELADRLSQLQLVFSREEERVLFVECIFKSLAKEWNHIDRWRMDKFLMMMRRVLRVLFVHLSSLKWKKSIREPYWAAFSRTTISTDKSFPDGLKFHFASIILDEMDNAGGINKKQITACLKPFADVLSIRGISDYLFESISEEIFATILHQKSEEIAAKMEADGEVDEKSTGIQFDYIALGKMLFDVGKMPETVSKRRRKLYDLVKRFDVAAKGGDPYHFEPPVPQIELTSKDLEEAELKLKKLQETVVLERIQMKLEKKRSRLGDRSCSKKPRLDGENEGSDEDPSTATAARPKKIKKKKKVNRNGANAYHGKKSASKCKPG
ncbi:Ribosomal RNA processing protein 1 [Trichostrongylus colubriformis]|uniref:Ribosomal RNA processing protein 1 n=1 Tax=Trichostrongylus colubriformis TaxID=6319 RepID=A0AAN8IW30_TRICO